MAFQRIRVQPFAGPSNTLRSINADADQTVNWMLEQTAPGTSGKVPIWIPPTPGLRVAMNLPDSPVRGMFEQDGRGFVVAGGTFFEVFSNNSFISRGSVVEDQFQASMCSNGSAGNQVLVVSGGNGYIFDLGSNSFGQIGDGDFPANVRTCEFIDGYFIVTIADTRQFNISALEDGTSWDPLDFGQRSEGSDNIQTCLRVGRTILFLGTKTSEPWYDSGDALFPFAPIQGSFIDHGCAAPFTAKRIMDTAFWLGLDELGAASVWRLDGLRPVTFSDPAAAVDIQTTAALNPTTLMTAVGWVYQQDDHQFYVLQVPNATFTWVYDESTQRWHNRARDRSSDINVFEWERHPADCHMFFGGKHLVGDRTSGGVYHMDSSFYDEEIIVL